MTHDLEQRKDHHLDLVLSANVERQGISPLFEDVHLVHDALPELDVANLQLATPLLGKTLWAPLLIVGMTGGTERAGAINRDLAVVAQRHGVALGLGSQRAMHAAPARAETFSVREVAPDVLLFGNIGAQQIEQLGLPAVEELIKRIGADGFVHLNPAQELVQPGGDRRFRGLSRLDPTSRRRAGAPCLGEGDRVRALSLRCAAAGRGGRRRARRLRGRRNQLDAGGAAASSGVQEQLGGDSPAGAFRRRQRSPLSRIRACPVVASGGVRSGIDVAKGLALGRDPGRHGAPLPEGARARRRRGRRTGADRRRDGRPRGACS